MEKVKYPDVSLMIQGPLFNDKLDFVAAVPYYKTLFTQIIVSTYTEHLVGNTGFIDFCKEHDINIVHQTQQVGNVRNDNNIFLHSYTTAAGLRSCYTRYTIKHRTDERYSNLEKLVDKFMLDDSKWVCGSMVFGPKVYYPYHAADHLFMGKTEALLKTFNLTLQNLHNGILETSRDGGSAPEITFTKNWLRTHGENPTEENHDELMRRYFDIVNDKEFAPFLIRSNGTGSIFTTLDDLGPNRMQYETIDDIINKPYLPGS
jgi:hypothetical protein